MLGFLTAIRLERGVAGLVTVLGVCKAASTGAYFTGRLVGGPKLMPRVSPKKTVAGAGGSVAAAVAVALALSRSPWSVTSPGAAPFYGLAVAAAALLGDLAESVLKREGGLKDSARLLPGLGGMLDMLDDVLFAAPASFLFLHFNQLLTTGG
jgi:phosphatidate cytidylyltransferase